MKNYIPLGPTPNNEDCAQVSSDNFKAQSAIEIAAYIAQLKRMFLDLPPGVTITSKAFQHDSGTYREVVVNYDDNDKNQADSVIDIENNLPENWDKEAKNIVFSKKDEISKLNEDALYKEAMKRSGCCLLEFDWDDLPDTNSMWDYIQVGMSSEQLDIAVKEACENRIDGIFV